MIDFGRTGEESVLIRQSNYFLEQTSFLRMTCVCYVELRRNAGDQIAILIISYLGSYQ
jgi:hypothetical protein